MIMSYLSLVNEVLIRLNEVPLTAENFNEARGYQRAVKGHVNTAIRRINQQQYEWPFNHVYGHDVLEPGMQRYDLPFDCKTVDWESFFLTGEDDSAPLKLRYIRYDDWMNHYKSGDERSIQTGLGFGKPLRVFRTQSMEFGITPVPDKPYEVSYEYWRVAGDMISADDQTNIPEQYRWVIIEGALSEAYKFRDNMEMSALAEQAFLQGIKDMRKVLVNHYDYIHTTAIIGRH